MSYCRLPDFIAIFTPRFFAKVISWMAFSRPVPIYRKPVLRCNIHPEHWDEAYLVRAIREHPIIFIFTIGIEERERYADRGT